MSSRDPGAHQVRAPKQTWAGPAPLQPAPIAASPWIILIVLALGFFMILLDTTIVNIAIPSLIDGLHATLDQILWILNAYILVYAVLLITAGRLGDMVGPKRLFIGGLVLFTLASAACGLAQDPGQLIAFRVLQAVGGAVLTPQSLSIITSIFPPAKRGAAFGVWGGVAGLAAVAGPTLGGFLVTNYSWRAIFYVNVPIGIAAVILAFLLMPDLRSNRAHELDLVGVFLATVGLLSTVFALIEGQRYNWGSIWDTGAFSIGPMRVSLVSIPSLVLYGLILLAVFIWWEGRQDEPLLPLSLFSERNFTVANVVSAAVAFGMLGLFLPLTIFLQSVLGMSAQEAGIALLPNSLTSMVIAPFAGRLADRYGGKYILTIGLVLFAVGMGTVIYVSSLHAQGTTFTIPLIISGMGMGFTFAPMVSVAMRNVAPAQAGAASGFINTIRQVGGTIGSSAVGAILAHRLATALHNQAIAYSAQLPPRFRTPFVQGFSHGSGALELGRGQTGAQIPRNLPVQVQHQLQLVGQEVFQHAYLTAMKPSLAVPIGAILIAAIATFFMRRESGQEAAQRQGQQPSGGIAAAGE